MSKKKWKSFLNPTKSFDLKGPVLAALRSPCDAVKMLQKEIEKPENGLYRLMRQ